MGGKRVWEYMCVRACMRSPLRRCRRPLLADLLARLAHDPLPSLPAHSPLNLPLHPCRPPSSPTTSPSSLTSSPIHTAISTPNSTPHHFRPLTLLATSSPITAPAQCPTLLGRMGEGTAGKRGVGTGMDTWVSVCVRSWVRERIRSFRSGVRASVRMAADICSGVSVGKHTGGSWRTCRYAYVGRE